MVSAGKSKRDISKEVSLCEKLVKEATHDQLTGLSTRRKLEEFVNMLISSSHRSNRLFAILFIDLNNFKPINDLHGHEAGEAVLKSIAKRISALTRQEDLCARIGGDEFVVVISELKNNSKLKFITARYASELSKNIAYEDYSISISATTFPADGKDYTSLIQHADRAMYREKLRDANGRSDISHTLEPNEADKTCKQLYSLTYISESLVSKEGILDVLNQIKEKSEINNSKQHITGKLLLKGEHFLQRLEGEKVHLEKCFERVKKDNRHQNIQLLYLDKITDRYFKDWSQMPIVTLNGTSDAFDKLVSDVQTQDIHMIDEQSIIHVFDAVTNLSEDKSAHLT
ncbi:hypothetical protein A3715_17520 [Oleiphilus sp. HI0009]|nr:hypothetical protein A3715_02870 [Oleiphilus sp. HI0009]KZX84814.1 hypothetical protein A3715_17520 [Oleiphilus sp. HI0009]KZY64472.1 hypothetical protein A3738_01545 [Oleiphilus sp. HI0066]KZY71628.1 hypothetical protein A3739_04345 [Oleiphilus sp. HI0067]